MKTTLKIVKGTGLLVILFLFILSIVVFARKDRTFDAPYPAIHAVNDSVVITRGKELVYGAAHCAHCHTPVSQLDAIERGEIVPLAGGHIFDIPPAKIYTPNITSDKETGIGAWPDSVIARSLRYGVGHAGSALVDFMPFQHLSDADLTAVISYLKTVPPVKNKVPATKWKLLGTVLKALVIEPTGPTIEIPQHVAPGATVEYGKYLAESVANCRGCHTERDLKTGKYIGTPYAGGFHMPCEVNPALEVVTPNITSDAQTGKLANWTEEEFLQRFRKGKVIHESTMPWGPFSRLADDDLRAIYRFLKTVPPVTNDPGPVLVSVK